MIPTIGLMIAAYIAMRCIEVFTFSRERYSSETAQGVMIFVAIAVLLVTGVLSLSLLTSGA